MGDIGLQGAYGAQGGADALMQAWKAALQSAEASNDVALKNRQLDQTDALTRLKVQELADAKAGQLQDKKDARAQLMFSLTPIGGDVSPVDMAAQQAAGIPQGMFKPKPINAPAPPDALAAPGQPSGEQPMPGTVASSPAPAQQQFVRGATQADLTKQDEQDRKNQATQSAIDSKVQMLEQAAEHLKQQGELNASRMLLMQAQAERDRALAGAAEKKGSTINLSQAGKSAKAAIENAGPLTDQALKMLEQQFPGIGTDSNKYNSRLDKLGSVAGALKYKAGFADENDPRRQIVSLLQPIQAGQYTRSSRSRQMLDLALQHMGDMTQTPAAQYQRLKDLRSIMPEMLEGLVRAEQPVDPNNPLAGSYFDPAKQQGAQEFDYVPGKGLVPRKP